MFPPKASLHGWIFTIAASAVVVSLPFSILTNSFFIILLTLNWLAEGEWRKKWLAARTNPVLLASISLYLLYAAGLLYSSNISQGTFILEKKLALLVLPIVLFTQVHTGPLSKRIMLLMFIGACLSFVVYYAFQLLFVHFDQVKAIQAEGLSTRVAIFNIFNIHPTYASTYLIFAAIASLFLMFDSEYALYTPKRYWLLLALPVLACAVFVLAARGPLLIAVFIAVGFLIKKTYLHRYFLAFCLAGLLLISTSAVIVWKGSKATRDRFMELSTPANYEIPRTGGPFNSTNTRVALLHASGSLLQQYWLTGTGTGDLQKKLDAYYLENDFHIMLSDDHYNTHNQYIETWLTLGIAGLVCFLYFIFIISKNALLSRDSLVLSLILFLAINSMSEAVLETQKGIVFYVWFLCFLTRPIKK